MFDWKSANVIGSLIALVFYARIVNEAAQSLIENSRSSILVPIAFFASLSQRGPWHEKRRTLETTDFQGVFYLQKKFQNFRWKFPIGKSAFHLDTNLIRSQAQDFLPVN